MRPYVDETKCMGHAKCGEICPADPVVFEVKDGVSKVVHPEACVDRGGNASRIARRRP